MKALLFGYYGYINLGDELMLVCLSKWLGERGVSITVASETPETVTSTRGLPAVRNVPLLGEWEVANAWLRGGALRVLSAMRSHDLIIIGGGDLIRDDRGWRTFAFTVEKIAAARMLDKTVVLLNVGIGVPHTGYGRTILPWALRQCARIVVRDRRSVEVCAQAGVRAVFLPDIVLTLPSLFPSQPTHQAPYLAVCMKDHAGSLGDAQLQILAGALDEYSTSNGLETRCIPFQETDNLEHSRLASRMRTPCRVLPWSAEISELVSRIGNAHAVLAIPLHAAVLAVAYRKPCVAIPYDHKVREFAQLAGLSLLETAGLERDGEAVAALEHGFKTLATPVDTAAWSTQRLLD